MLMIQVAGWAFAGYVSAAPAVQPSTAAAAQAASFERTVAHATVHAVVGPMETPIDLDLANELLDHPDLAAFIVRTHAIANYQVRMLDAVRSWADDGDGTVGEITLVERQETRRVYYAEGTHHSLLFPPIRATAVIIAGLAVTTTADCGRMLASTFDVSVRLRNPVLATVVKALRPFLQKTVVRKFTRAFSAAHEVGKMISRDPAVVEKDVRGFVGLPPEDLGSMLRLIEAHPRLPPACLHD